MGETARWLLVFAVYPLWVAAGTADWACHRSTRIELHGGLPENLFHWALYAQGGIGVVLAMLCEPTGGLLLALLAVFLLHELTVYVELRYAVPRREVRPIEQMVHSVQEIVPLAGIALLAVQAGPRITELALQPRSAPWPLGLMAAAVAATALFNLLPLAEECVRCRKALHNV